MTTIKVELPEKLKEAHIHTFADLHIGDPLCDIKHIKERIEEVKNDETAYIILNGDIINNATKNSVSDIYSEVLSPMSALQVAVDLFKPVKDKILCITQGNHEARTYRESGADLMRIMAKELAMEERYSPIAILLFLRLGKNEKMKESKGHKRQIWYSVYVTHGSGGGRTTGSKANALEQLAGIIDCDIYIHSHTHSPLSFPQDFFRANANNSSVQKVTHIFINTNAELDYGGYGETAKFKPASKAITIITLSGRHKRISAHMIF